MAKTQVGSVNLDDLDEEGAVGVADDGNDEFNQPVDFESITGTVPPGEYFLHNEKVELTRSKSSNRPMFNVRATILSGQFEGQMIFQNFSWAPGRAQVMSKKAFVGMGMSPRYTGTLQEIADKVLPQLEYYAVVTVTQSEGINEATQQPYDPQNRIVSTSEMPITSG